VKDPVRYVPTHPDSSPDSQQALRGAVHDLRLEAERRAWARRPTRGVLGGMGGLGALLAPLTPPTLPADSPPHDPASDPLVGILALLRTEVTRYVYGLRAEGARPEQMIVQVKGFVREIMRGEGWTDDPDATRLLTAQVVRWSIEAYYDG
jgi:hypothetical protein